MHLFDQISVPSSLSSCHTSSRRVSFTCGSVVSALMRLLGFFGGLVVSNRGPAGSEEREDSLESLEKR